MPQGCVPTGHQRNLQYGHGPCNDQHRDLLGDWTAGPPVTGTVSLDVTGTIATFTPLSPLAPSTTYMATITTGVTDLAGNPLASAEVWSFTTGRRWHVSSALPLGAAAPFGAFGGGAGMTNQGINTVINGDIGTTGCFDHDDGIPRYHLVPYIQFTQDVSIPKLR